MKASFACNVQVINISRYIRYQGVKNIYAFMILSVKMTFTNFDKSVLKYKYSFLLKTTYKQCVTKTIFHTNCFS